MLKRECLVGTPQQCRSLIRRKCTTCFLQNIFTTSLLGLNPKQPEDLYTKETIILFSRLVDEEVCGLEYTKQPVERLILINMSTTLTMTLYPSCEDRPKQLCEVVDVRHQCRNVTTHACETK